MKLLHPAALFLTFVLTAGSAVAFAAPDLTEALKKDGGGPAAYLHQFDQKDSPYYVHPDFYRMKSHGSLLLLSHYRTHQQETEYTCGPAAALTVADYYLGKSPHSEMEIARIMNASVGNGRCRNKYKGNGALFYRYGLDGPFFPHGWFPGNL